MAIRPTHSALPSVSPALGGVTSAPLGQRPTAPRSLADRGASCRPRTSQHTNVSRSAGVSDHLLADGSKVCAESRRRSLLPSHLRPPAPGKPSLRWTRCSTVNSVRSPRETNVTVCSTRTARLPRARSCWTSRFAPAARSRRTLPWSAPPLTVRPAHPKLESAARANRARGRTAGGQVGGRTRDQPLLARPGIEHVLTGCVVESREHHVIAGRSGSRVSDVIVFVILPCRRVEAPRAACRARARSRVHRGGVPTWRDRCSTSGPSRPAEPSPPRRGASSRWCAPGEAVLAEDSQVVRDGRLRDRDLASHDCTEVTGGPLTAEKLEQPPPDRIAENVEPVRSRYDHHHLSI